MTNDKTRNDFIQDSAQLQAEIDRLTEQLAEAREIILKAGDFGMRYESRRRRTAWLEANK